MNTLFNKTVKSTLLSLHQQAQEESNNRKIREQKSGERESHTNAFLSISAEQGEFLYFLARVKRAKNIVEFGCSFGISAIYLAAAAKDNNGKVTTTEMEPNKVQEAGENISSANLESFVRILEGDATKTLISINEEVDFLFLDGAKDLYLPIYQLLKPILSTGAVIVADNMDKEETRPFLEEIIKNKEDYAISMLFENRMLVAYSI